MSKFNKKLLRVLGLGALAIVLVCGFASLNVFAKNSDTAFCGKTNKVLFGFNDKHHTKLLIPEAYLYDPYYLYHKVKDPTEFIKISVRKDNFLPPCDNDEQSSQSSHKIVLKSMTPEGFKVFSKNMSDMYPDYDGIENNNLKIYRNKKNESVLARVDFLLPDNSEKIFLQCKYVPRNPVFRSTCRVFSLVNQNVYAEYGIPNAELPQLMKIDLGVQRLVESFILDGKK